MLLLLLILLARKKIIMVIITGINEITVIVRVMIEGKKFRIINKVEIISTHCIIKYLLAKLDYNTL